MKFLQLSAIALLGLGCTTPEPYDYGTFLNYMPSSLLVLPPLENTIEANVAYDYLSTVPRPLAERGYYVFPPALVAGMMRDNGLPTPHEMHSLDRSSLLDVFGADAVLY